MLYINYSYTVMTCSYLPVAMLFIGGLCLLILFCFCATAGVEVLFFHPGLFRVWLLQLAFALGVYPGGGWARLRRVGVRRLRLQASLPPYFYLSPAD